MASSLSRTLFRSLFPNPLTKSLTPTTKILSPLSYCTDSSRNAADFDAEDVTESPPDPVPELGVSERPPSAEYSLEKGLDYGVYKAILVGQVGQTPVQKKLRNGHTVTMLSIGTGGMRNNRTPFENEDPIDYANRCVVQWHRVTIYGANLGDRIKNVTPGSILYLEGSLETQLYSDPVSGIVRRLREVAVRKSGRIVFLGRASNFQMPNHMTRVGYF